MEWEYLSIPKLQRSNRWSLGMDKWFHPTLYNGCDYLSMLGLKLIHVSKRGLRKTHFEFAKYTSSNIVFPHFNFKNSIILTIADACRYTYTPCFTCSTFSANWNLRQYISDIYRHRSWASLVRVMACGLIGGKPLPEPMLTYCQLDPQKT